MSACGVEWLRSTVWGARSACLRARVPVGLFPERSRRRVFVAELVRCRDTELSTEVHLAKVQQRGAPGGTWVLSYSGTPILGSGHMTRTVRAKIASRGAGPKSRLSCEKVRLSPRTK